jgi:hypothetical protein
MSACLAIKCGALALEWDMSTFSSFVRTRVGGAILSVASLCLLVLPGDGGELVSPFEVASDDAPGCRGDALVFQKLAARGVTPAARCSDAVFLRRVYLDVIGTLPTAKEAREFLDDERSGKRQSLISRLMARDEFADYWALKWGDLLRVKSEFPINLWPNAAQAYHRWVRASIAENVPYDQFAREILVASGSNFRVPPVNFYRSMQSKTPEAISKGVALGFMGVRTDGWAEKRRTALSAFFSEVGFKGTSEWKEEIVYHDSWQTNVANAAALVLPDGTVAKVKPGRDPREVFVDWLITPENPWFAANAVNRVWYWLMGRGIVHHPDDFRPDNPPQNPELLAWLAEQLVAADYDLRHIYRLILNSQIYQQSSIPASDHPDGSALFAHYPVRRLDAEVLIDAICQITGTTEKYTSATPEPFTFIPEDQRSIELMDGSISSPFLDMFGRPPRDTGLLSERSNRPTPSQRLHLLNSSHIRNKFERSGKLKKLLASAKQPSDRIERLYLTILSRRPTAQELAVAAAYQKDNRLNPRDASSDLAWALINTKEFLYRH